MFTDFVDGADVGVIQRGSRSCFAQKTLEGLLIARHVSGKKLQRDVAAERRVFGPVDHTHPAAAQLLDDAVVRDGLTNHLRQRSAWIDGFRHQKQGQSGSNQPGAADVSPLYC